MGSEGNSRDFATGLRSGIFDPRHFKAIGIALWTFAWCVDRQTDAKGGVLGGKVLTYREIAEGVGLETPKQARSQVDRLVLGGYLARETVPMGIRLRVSAPKKALRSNPARGGHPPARGGHPPARGGHPPARGGQGVYKERDSEETQRRLNPLPPTTAPEDLYALASEYGFRLDVMNGAFTAGQNGHLFVDVLRLPVATLRACLASIAQREKRYQPGSAAKWIEALLAEAAKTREPPSYLESPDMIAMRNLYPEKKP